jgi:hypothetical protein
MKFYTKKWYQGKLPHRESELIVKKYNQYFRKVLSKIPTLFRHHIKNLNLHDGLIDQFVIDKSKKEICLSLICGDNQRGYSKVEIKYKEPQGVGAATHKIRKLLQNRDTEILYDEFDLSNDGRFIHRYLFWPEFIELKISFKSLNVQSHPKQNRRLSVIKNRLKIIMHKKR